MEITLVAILSVTNIFTQHLRKWHVISTDRDENSADFQSNSKFKKDRKFQIM